MATNKQFNQFDPKTPFFVNLDNKGRLILPAEIRKKAGFKAGDRFAISLGSDSVIYVSSVSEKIRSLRGILKATKRKKSVVDEFLAERRKEALDE